MLRNIDYWCIETHFDIYRTNTHYDGGFDYIFYKRTSKELRKSYDGIVVIYPYGAYMKGSWVDETGIIETGN